MGKGSGDLYIKSSAQSITSTTYTIEDCIYYHDMTSADSTHWTIPSSANASYSSSGMKLQGSAWTDCYLEIPLTKPYSVEFDLTQWSGATTYQHYFYDSTKATRLINMYKANDSTTVLDVSGSYANKWNSTIPEGSHVKIEVNSDNLKLYVNDDFKVGKSYTMPSSSIFGVSTATSRSVTWKNIKIKPL